MKTVEAHNAPLIGVLEIDGKSTDRFFLRDEVTKLYAKNQKQAIKDAIYLLRKNGYRVVKIK